MLRLIFKILFGLGVIALLAGGIYWGWTKTQSGTKSENDYSFTKVKRGDIIQIVTATGQINPKINVQVGSQISGIIEHLEVDFNSPVKAGQVVAQMDPSIYHAVVVQAEGDLASAKANLELTTQIEKRTQNLRAVDSASDEDVEKAVADRKKAEADIQVKEGAINKAKVDLGHCTIYSPIDGIVISRNVDVGQTVAASLNSPTLFMIANDLRNMQIDANVAEADVGAVKPGLDVDFYVDAYPSRLFRGKVVEVRNAPIIVQNVVTYDVVIDVDNSELLLKPGMTANVSILVTQKRNVLTIRNAALRFRPAKKEDSEKSGSQKTDVGRKPTLPDMKSVYRLSDSPEPSEIKRVEIKIGISDGINTEVMEGLNEGDQVIIGMNKVEKSSGPANNPLTGAHRRM